MKNTTISSIIGLVLRLKKFLARYRTNLLTMAIPYSKQLGAEPAKSFVRQ